MTEEDIKIFGEFNTAIVSFDDLPWHCFNFSAFKNMSKLFFCNDSTYVSILDFSVKDFKKIRNFYLSPLCNVLDVGLTQVKNETFFHILLSYNNTICVMINLIYRYPESFLKALRIEKETRMLNIISDDLKQQNKLTKEIQNIIRKSIDYLKICSF